MTWKSRANSRANGPSKLKAARQAGNENQRWSVAPHAIAGCVVRQMGQTGATDSRTELRTAPRQPIKRCLHSSSPTSEVPELRLR